MNRPPTSPQRYRIHYRDGRVETLEARTCVRVGDHHVFYREKDSESLRVPIDSVLRVETLKVDSWKARRRRA